MFSITDYSLATTEQLRTELMEFYDLVYRESLREDADRANIAKDILSMFKIPPHQMSNAHVESMRLVMSGSVPDELRLFSFAINSGALDENGVIHLLGMLQRLEESNCETTLRTQGAESPQA